MDHRIQTEPGISGYRPDKKEFLNKVHGGGIENGRESENVNSGRRSKCKESKEFGKKISKEYEGKQIHLICVLKGGVFFMCELAKRITVPVTMDFMSVSSYGDGTKSSGVVKIAKDLDETLEGKDVLIGEDIIDSGRTLSYLMDILSKRNPKSMKLCTLLDKPERRVKDVKSRLCRIQYPGRIRCGYGLDYAQNIEIFHTSEL